VDNNINNHVSLWNLVYEKLKELLPGHAINTWFEPLVPITITDEELVIEVPNQFSYEWIDSHYQKNLVDAIGVVTENQISYRFIVSAKGQKKQKEESESYKKVEKVVEPAPNNLNKTYTFKSFIKGANNEFAKSAAQSVSESPGKNSFNPLIIYGGVGLGKTHLIHSIGNKIHEKNPRSKVVIVTSEKFTLDFVNSLRKNRTIEFAQQYRNADVLLIDDIQFFRGKEQTQEQFFHTFNVLQQAGKQIVMTTDKYPAEIKGLQERLLSRFQSGLSVDIQPPNLEIRIAILLEKAEQNGIRLDYNIIEFIAKHIKKNVRDLEGAIIRILAKSSLMNKEIDFQLVKEVIRERIGSSFSPELSIEDVVKKVSEISNVSEIEIVGKSRKMEVAEARQVSMYLCRKIIGTSLNNIGVFFGGRDHSTVIHAVKTIDEKIINKKHIKEQIESIKQELDFSLA
jgi:chromosomal replication initiator protein